MNAQEKIKGLQKNIQKIETELDRLDDKIDYLQYDPRLGDDEENCPIEAELKATYARYNELEGGLQLLISSLEIEVEKDPSLAGWLDSGNGW